MGHTSPSADAAPTAGTALFNLGIDSKLRACGLVKLRVRDVRQGDHVAARAVVMQQKTQRPVQFEITPQTREAVDAWIKHAALKSDDYLHTKLESTVRYLGIELDDALEIAEQTEV